MITGYCPSCDEDKELRIELRQQTLDVRGEIITVESDVAVCPSCGTQVACAGLDDKLLAKVYEVYRSRHNLLRPEEIRAIRVRWGLSQRALSRLLGWGVITVQRYEAGALQDNAHDVILQQLEDSRFVRDLITRSGGRLSDKERKMLQQQVSTTYQINVGTELDRVVEESVAFYSPAMSEVDRGFRPFDLERFKQATVWFADRCAGQLFRTKLAKLLWLADFAYFRRNRVSITGLTYARAPHGPMPHGFQLLLGLLENERTIELVEESAGPYVGEVIEAREVPSLKDWEPEEVETLERVASLFGNDTSANLSLLSHKESAWADRANGDIIPYTEADRLSLLDGFWDVR